MARFCTSEIQWNPLRLWHVVSMWSKCDNYFFSLCYFFNVSLLFGKGVSRSMVQCDTLVGCTNMVSASAFVFSDRGSQGALDLTELIGVPLPPSVSFVTGFEGYPAYSFGPDANVGRLTKSFIPDPFYSDFAITVTAKPTTRRGGMLFAITDAYQKVRHCNFL